MARDDWFRAERWDAAHADEFEVRLARARARNRAQYLRIQGYTLSASTRKADRLVARDLLERALELAQAPETRSQLDELRVYVDLAALALRDEGPENAAEYERAAVDVNETYGGMVSGADLRLATLITKHCWRERYTEAAELLDAADARGLLLADEQFEALVARMRLARGSGERELAADYALQALTLVAENRPTLARLPTFGVIDPGDIPLRELKRTLGGRSRRWLRLPWR